MNERESGVPLKGGFVDVRHPNARDLLDALDAVGRRSVVFILGDEYGYHSPGLGKFLHQVFNRPTFTAAEFHAGFDSRLLARWFDLARVSHGCFVSETRGGGQE